MIWNKHYREAFQFIQEGNETASYQVELIHFLTDYTGVTADNLYHFGIAWSAHNTWVIGSHLSENEPTMKGEG